MKWGGRKPSSPSPSSKPSFMSSFSWLFKFKQMRLISSEPKPVKPKKLNSSPSHGRFYGENDENFWRLSFTKDKENHHEEHNKTEDEEGILKPTSVLHGFEDELKLERLNAKKNGTRKQGKDKDKVKERKVPNETKVSMEMMEECNNDNIREKELGFLRRRYDRKVQSVLQEQLSKLEKASEETTEKDVMQFESSPRTICTPRTHFRRSDREAFEKKLSEELKANINKQKLSSVNVSREIHRRKPKHGSKVKVHSPRLASKVEICKIKAIEDMKKARMMKMKNEEEIVVEEKTSLDHSFAVVKCSMDPQRDFRDSMIEMIMEKKINKAEEMEELLACYLTLNSSEYHDLIIKVFKQVWLYMSQASMYAKSNKQCCCYD
ncbi:hypothetical protein RIF29_42086 [Crotalaria pallida]|uniref:Transcription repressor n=1 Tax=Crotalaria pallida TaxID=3830 RepID=A0AAN9E6P5_CROPI